MLVCARTMGQPVMTEADMPAPGMAWTVYELSELPPIGPGSNVMWDFSGVVITETSQLQTAEPSTAPGASNFPSATAVTFRDNEPPYFFSEVTESQMRTLGAMNTAPLIYSDPLTTMVLPCTYGTTWTDTYANPESQGERTSAADGYGTLVGPGGSFSDVLKVHTEYTSLDTTINDVYYQGLVLQDVFWRNGIGWPLVTSIRSIVYVDGQPIQETWVGSALELFFTGVQELSAIFPARVWPNPTVGQITVEFADRLVIGSYCGLYDTMGRLLHEWALFAGATMEEIDLSRFGKGSFVLKFTKPNGSRYARVVVE